ncbi:hypothetical protein F5888DRAFT_337344 [Russula emetica]|nr:hypothetical protein F5888DRAFT_337344 [Russula emetica]
MSPTSDAYILVTIPNAILTSSSTRTLTGQLVLESVTYDVPTTAQVAQDVLLVLVLRSGNNNTVLFEAPLDPTRALSVSSVPPPSSFGFARQRYVFQATRDDAEFTVEIPKNNNNSAGDIELLHSVLVRYLTDVRVNGERLLQSAPALLPSGARVVEEATPAAPVAGAGADEDLRGRFVLMNEDDGEIVGTLDRSVRVFEDPSIKERGREKDTLVVEVPEGADTQDGLLGAEVLVNTIPPEDRDWMIKTAVFVSHAISGTTTRLTSAMTSASNLYIANSTPCTTTAPGSTAASPLGPTTPSSSSSSASQSQGQSHGGRRAPPPPPPSRTLRLLQSPTTRKGLTQIHAVSGSATKLSDKATTLIQRTIGSGSSSSNSNSRFSSIAEKIKSKSRSFSDTVGSPMPQPQPQPRRQQPPTAAPAPAPAPPPPPPLRTRTRLALSAALILSSMETSALQLVEAGGAAVSAAVTHKYGTEAAENAAIVGRTVRNIVLVYVDVHGLGRRVIVKPLAKTWVKGHIASVRQETAAAMKR